MVLNDANVHMDRLKREFDRIYAYATSNLSSNDIGKLLDVMDEYQGRLLLYRRRMCD